MSGPARKVLMLGQDSGAVWLEMAQSAARILEKLQKHGFTALRCIADGQIVVSAYLITTVQHVKEAASSAERYYPHTQRLEVLGVRADVSGAVVRPIVAFTAQALPTSRTQQQEEVSLC